MSDIATEKVGLKRDWTLTGEAFRRLLAWLDEGAQTDGEKYVEMRRRLVSYFDRKSCHAPEELADETLNRVARRLEEEGAIECDSPAHYCYIVARFVFMEFLRGAERETDSLDELAREPAAPNSATPDSDDERERREKMLECLERCAARLDEDSRELIIAYYTGERRAKIENRRAIAAKLNVSQNALSIRACRIRDKLEACVKKCADSG